MRSSSATIIAPPLIALTPRRGLEEWTSKPLIVVKKLPTLLCASATCMEVGSPTITAPGRGRSAPIRAITSITPRQVVSSS